MFRHWCCENAAEVPRNSTNNTEAVKVVGSRQSCCNIAEFSQTTVERNTVENRCDARKLLQVFQHPDGHSNGLHSSADLIQSQPSQFDGATLSAIISGYNANWSEKATFVLGWWSLKSMFHTVTISPLQSLENWSMFYLQHVLWCISSTQFQCSWHQKNETVTNVLNCRLSPDNGDLAVPQVDCSICNSLLGTKFRTHQWTTK